MFCPFEDLTEEWRDIFVYELEGVEMKGKASIKSLIRKKNHGNELDKVEPTLHLVFQHCFCL